MCARVVCQTGKKDVFTAGHAHQFIGGIPLDRPVDTEHKPASFFVIRALVVARSRPLVYGWLHESTRLMSMPSLNTLSTRND
jgi:hypothetical protein